jgi:ABC-type transporter Mla MlaB component
MLAVEHTLESYSGQPGCMCGCRGTYKTSVRARKMAITAMLNNSHARLDDFGRVDSAGVAGCVHYSTATRNRVLYLTAEGVAAAKTLFKTED